MSEFTFEDLEEVISQAENSLVQMLALQLRDQIKSNGEITAKCAALAAEVQAVRWACGQVYMKGYNHGHLNTVDGLDYVSDTELVERGGEALADFTDPDHCGVAADAILAEVRAQGVEMVIAYHHERSDALAEVDRNGSFRHHSAAIDATDVLMKIRQDANTENPSMLSSEDCQAFVQAFTKVAAK